MTRYSFLLVAVLSIDANAAEWKRFLVPIHAPAGVQGAGARFSTVLTAVSSEPCPYRAGDTTRTILPNMPSVNLGETPAPRAGRIVSVDASCADGVFFGLTLVSSTDPFRPSYVRSNIPVIAEDDAYTEPLQLMNIHMWLEDLHPFEQPRQVYRHRLRVYDFGTTGQAEVQVNYYIPFRGPERDFPSFQYVLRLDRREGEDDASPYFAELELPHICRGVNRCASWYGRVEVIPLTEGLRYWAFVASTENLSQQVMVTLPARPVRHSSD